MICPSCRICHSFTVVPAKAGTHSHRRELLKRSSRPFRSNNIRRGVWVPAFAGTTMVASSGLALQHLPLRQIAHQLADAERPGFALVATAHAVDELAELGRGDGNNIIAFVGEPLPRRVAIFYRREHG